MIGSREVAVGRRMEKVGGVGGFAFDAKKYVEGGGAGGGDEGFRWSGLRAQAVSMTEASGVRKLGE